MYKNNFSVRFIDMLYIILKLYFIILVLFFVNNDNDKDYYTIFIYLS
jgi:hypothetical protein